MSGGSSTDTSRRAFELTIVVPAFNEARRLADGLRRFDAAVAEGAIDLEETELILVDDGSTDATVSTATKLLSPVPHHRVVSLPANRGKGAAVRVGVAAARGRSIAYMDADMAIDPRAVPLLLDGLADHDIAVGSRALRDSMVETTYVVRSLLGRGFNRLVTAGTPLHLRDTQCGFKAFRAPVARLLFGLLNIDRFAFDFQLLWWGQRLGLSRTEVPVHWKHVAGSTIRPFNDSVSMFADVFRWRLGLMPVPAVPAISVEADSDDVRSVLDGVRRALSPAGADRAGRAGRAGRRSGDSDAARRASDDAGPGAGGGADACVVAHGRQVLVLFPLREPEEVAVPWAAIRAELEPLSVRRRMVTVAYLESMGPLAGRVRDAA